MAVAFKTALGTGVSASSGNALAIVTTAAIAIDDLVVIRIAADNLNATTPTISTITDGGNTYTVHKFQGQNATAAAGVVGAIAVTKATVARPSSTSINIGFSGSISNKAAYAESFTGAENTVRSTAVSAAGATGNAASPASGTVNAGDLVLGAAMVETRANSTGDTDTTNGSWSTITQIASGTSAGDATRVLASGQYKIATATGAQTYNTTNTSTDWVALIVVLQATPTVPPAITQAAYQFFDEVGGESGAAALAAQDTAVTGNLYNGDGYGHIRIRLQSTNASAIPSTDDFYLQWEKNASGSWTNADTGAVIGYDSAGLTEGAATTNRLTGGTGTFTPGKVSEIGHATNVGWNGNNYTEILFSVKILAAQFTAGDTLRFRVVKNGATTDMTYSVTPTINLVFTPPIPLVVDNCFHSHVSQEPAEHYLWPPTGTVSMPDPGPLPSPCVFVFKTLGPINGTPNVNNYLLGQWNAGSGDLSYIIIRWPAGSGSVTNQFRTEVSTDGANSAQLTTTTAPVVTPSDQLFAISLAFTPSFVMTTRQSSDEGASWVQVDTKSQGGAIPFDAAQAVRIGNQTGGVAGNSFYGRIYFVELRTGTDPNAGTVVWRFDAKDHVSGTSWTDARGHTWTLTSASAISHDLATSDVVITHVPATNLVVQSAQHAFVNQTDMDVFLTPSVSRATTPDPGPLPTDGFVFVFKCRGPVATSTFSNVLASQNRGSPNQSFQFNRVGQTGGLSIMGSANGTTGVTTYVASANALTGGIQWPTPEYLAFSYIGTTGVWKTLRSSNSGTSYAQVSTGTGTVGGTFFDSSDIMTIGGAGTGATSVYDDFLYWVELRTGTDPKAGTLLWRMDVAEHVSGTTWTDARSRVWTLTSAAAVTRPVTNTPTIEHVVPIPLVVQNAQHNFVTDVSPWLAPSLGRAFTTDPGPFPPSGFVFVVKAQGPQTTSTTLLKIATQNKEDPTRAFRLTRRGSDGLLSLVGYADGVTGQGFVSHVFAIDRTAPQYYATSVAYPGATYTSRALQSTDGGATYTVMDTAGPFATSGIFDTADPLIIGADATGAVDIWDDRIYWVELRTGIDPKAGSLLWRFDPSEYVSGTAWTDARGRLWTLMDAASIVYPPAVAPTLNYVVLDVNNCFHSVVSTSALEAYITPSSTAIASTPDPGPLPNTYTFVIKTFGPTSGTTGQVIASQWSVTSGDNSWQFYRSGPAATSNPGNVQVWYSYDGGGSAQGPGSGAVTPPNQQITEYFSLQVTRNPSSIALYRSLDDGNTWVLAGSASYGGNEAPWDSSLPVRIGTAATTYFPGRIYYVELRNGLGPTAGSVVWRFDATEHVAGNTSWVDARGRTWTLNGASTAITHVGGQSDVVITHIPAVNLVIQNAQHAFVEQNDLNKFLVPSVSKATTPDPHTFPTDGFVFVAKVRGPQSTSVNSYSMVSQNRGSPNNSFNLQRRGSDGNITFGLYADGSTNTNVLLGVEQVDNDLINPQFISTSYVATTGAFSNKYSLNGGSTYIQAYGATGTAITTFDSSTDMTIGAGATGASGIWDDRIYWIELRTGTDPVGGTLLWKFDANEHVIGTSWTDLRGKTWTLTTAAAIVTPTTTVPTIEVQVAPTLANADSYHTVDSSTPTLTQQHVLVVDNATHVHIATSPVAASAVRFDTPADAYWRSSTGLSPSSPVTFACWVYLSVDTNNYTTWIGADNGAGDGYLFLGTGPNGTAMSFDAGGGNGLFSVVNLTVGQWYYTAGVYDPAGTDTLYYAAAGSGTLTVADSNTNLAPGNPFTTFWVGSDTFTDGVNGRVAQVKAWSAALTKTELEAEMPLNGVARTANLWGYYSFRNGPQTNDESGNGRTLTAGGTTTTEAGPPIGSGGDIALTQNHVLVVASAVHTQVADSPPLTQAHVLTAADAVHAQAVDHIAINTATNVPPADAAHAIISDSPALTQNHVLVVANAAHTVVSDNVTTNYVVLAPANAAHAHVVDAPGITQVHILTIQGAAHAQVADSPSITQLHILAAVANAAHAQVADNVAITQVHILVAQSAAHIHSCPEVPISTEGVVAGADNYHSLTSDTLALTQVHNLLVANALHAHSATSSEIVYNVNLTIANAAQAQSAEVPTLVYNIFLTVASAAHAHAVESVVLNYVVFVVANAAHAHTAGSPFIIVDIPIANAAHAHTASNIAITQAHNLTVADADHAHSVSGNPTLTQVHKLAVDSAEHAHTADEVAFTQDHFLVVADAQHVHSVDQDLALTQEHNIAVASAFHAHSVDEFTFEYVVWLEVWSAWHAHKGEEANLAGIVFLNEALALYLGARVVQAVYHGTSKVWP